MAKKGSPPKKKSDDIPVDGRSREEGSTLVSRTVLSPTVQAGITLQEYSKSYVDVDPLKLVDALTEQTRASSNGDTRRMEAMLTAQAHTLDAIFNGLARRAINAEYLDALDRYLKLALRAQSQCRATWEALATITNPPVMGYVRQANISHGHQQVNNAPSAKFDRRLTREDHNLQNKLLEKTDGERLDAGTACAAGRADPAMAPMGKIDRA